MDTNLSSALIVYAAFITLCGIVKSTKFKISDLYSAFNEILVKILSYYNKKYNQKKTMRQICTRQDNLNGFDKFLKELISQGEKKAEKLLTTILFLTLSLILINRGLLVIPIIYLMVNLPSLISNRINSAKEKQKLIIIQNMMSIVSLAYSRGNCSIITAFEQNVKNIEQPYRNYVEFLIFSYNNLDHSLENNLRVLAKNVDYFIFTEWINALILCSKDYTKHSILHPIEKNISFINAEESEHCLSLNQLRSNLYTMSSIYFATIPLFMFFTDKWLYLLFGTLEGNAVFAITCTITFATIKKGLIMINSNDFHLRMKGGE